MQERAVRHQMYRVEQPQTGLTGDLVVLLFAAANAADMAQVDCSYSSGRKLEVVALVGKVVGMPLVVVDAAFAELEVAAVADEIVDVVCSLARTSAAKDPFLARQNNRSRERQETLDFCRSFVGEVECLIVAVAIGLVRDARLGLLAVHFRNVETVEAALECRKETYFYTGFAAVGD